MTQAARKLRIVDGPRFSALAPQAIDLNAEFHRELRAKHPWNRGWGDDWITCPDCDRNPDCDQCGGEGGWPASATRHDELGEGE